MKLARTRSFVPSACILVRPLSLEDVGWDSTLERFVDLEEHFMATVFKLYPWEWALTDDFGKHVLASLPETMWLEPLQR